MTSIRLIALLLVAPALAACSDNGTVHFQGYVEGTFVDVAAETGGRLIERPVRAGQRVEAGDLLFALDDVDARENVAAAEARLAQAHAQLANLETGQRAEEVAVIAANLESARTAFNLAEDDYRRKLVLRETNVVAQSAVDAAKATRDSAAAQVEVIERQLLVARLPAREEEVKAAEKNVAALEAALAQAQNQLAKRREKAPVAGLVDNTYYEPGEIVPAGRAVVTLLPDANRKIRFYAPQARIAGLATGQTVAVSCDGCADGLTAVIDYISEEAEFTPPVIFSQETRDKLVFLVEAEPQGAAAELKVGLPIDVTMATGG